jgi:hypothetical protein
MGDTTDINAIAQFDVIKFARGMLSEVDAIRAVSAVTDDKTKSESQWPIESRLNAFCRLIGLPMFVSIEQSNKEDKNTDSGDLSGKRHLTPGYYGSKLSGYNVKNDTKIGVSVGGREAVLKSREEKIGSGKADDDMLKALYSVMPMTTTYPSGSTENKRTAVLQENKIGTGTAYERDIYKSLFPLATSYVNVQPMKNEVARPFLQTIKDQMPDSATVLPKPFIETVIRIRMISAANALDVNALEKIDDVVNGFISGIGEEEFNKLSGDVKKVVTAKSSINILEGLIIARLLSSLDQIAKKWLELQQRQQVYFTNSEYSISVKSTSSRFSPFGKRAAESTTLVVDPKTNAGKRLQSLKKQQMKEDAMMTLLPSDDSIYGSNSKTVAATKNTSLMALVTPFTKILSYNLEQTKKEIQRIENNIKRDTGKVEKLRVELETMSGEFTGLSVPDVIAVLIALFIIDEEYLIALLDTETKEEMKKDKRLKDAIESVGNPDGLEKATEAVEALEIAVQFVFDLLNALIIPLSNKSERSNDAQNRKRATKSSKRVQIFDKK